MLVIKNFTAAILRVAEQPVVTQNTVGALAFHQNLLGCQTRSYQNIEYQSDWREKYGEGSTIEEKQAKKLVIVFLFFCRLVVRVAGG